ncbi:cardiolipin synthase [Desulfogranum marinum]|uniref:cardiolipin synthase n=1 Tax=Desulfogranum marinum TaxID=453220 RepID=UPI001E4BB9C2|nr:cardiolipin synthase [Desulfogranum marinum]
MDKIYWILTTSIFITDLAIRIGLSLRVIMRKRAASVSLAWLIIILLLPFFGAIMYLLFGEVRLGERRASKILSEQPVISQWTEALYKRVSVDWKQINPECIPINRQIDAMVRIPTMPDNCLELISEPTTFLRKLITDIRRAKSSCFLQFYIWNEGGLADNVTDALIEAKKRGVTCRVLVDSIGSKPFLSSAPAEKMRSVGIEIAEALPAGLIRALFVRIDLRNHRKVAIIDGTIAYTGSQNLVDPSFFKQDQGVGKWIDAMVRIRGPVVEVMTAAFTYDWMMENHIPLEDLYPSSDIHPVDSSGNALVQLVPSGPNLEEGAIHNLLLTTIYAARKKLILTTPYFVPDNAILAALKSAAQRGVDVTIIVPEKNDSRLVHYASRARYEVLTKAGVEIMGFSGGLLHTKTITIDDDFCLFGSVNLDMRSFWLNFEMTLFIYNKEFTARVRELQQSYVQSARKIDCELFTRRPFRERFMENVALLVGPLL